MTIERLQDQFSREKIIPRVKTVWILIPIIFFAWGIMKSISSYNDFTITIEDILSWWDTRLICWDYPAWWWDIFTVDRYDIEELTYSTQMKVNGIVKPDGTIRILNHMNCSSWSPLWKLHDTSWTESIW